MKYGADEADFVAIGNNLVAFISDQNQRAFALMGMHHQYVSRMLVNGEIRLRTIKTRLAPPP